MSIRRSPWRDHSPSHSAAPGDLPWHGHEVDIQHAPEGQGVALHYWCGCSFRLESGGDRVFASWRDEVPVGLVAAILLGPVMGYVLRLKGWVPLHASAVRVGDHCIAIVGSSGSGKSTTAAGLVLEGFPLVADDVLPILKTSPRTEVHSAFPMMRLWPSSTEMLLGDSDSLPWLIPGSAESDKRLLRLSDRGLPFAEGSQPLGGIFVLDEDRSHVSSLKVARMSPADALQLLLTHTYVNYSLTSALRAREFRAIGELVTQVPVWKLHLPLGHEGIAGLARHLAHPTR